MKTALVTGKSGPLLAEIVQESVARGCRTVVARSGHLELPGPPVAAATTISWNRRSALSARSVLLQIVNLHRSIDQVIIAYVPTQESVAFHESTIVSIEDRVDAEVKGYQFLLRELIGHLQKQGRGRLVLAVQDLGGPLRSPLEAAALGSFMAVGESLYHFYRNEPFDIQLLYTPSDDGEAYARFIVDTVNTDVPRRRRSPWTRHPARAPIFNLNT